MASTQLSIILPCYNPPDGWYEQVLNSWVKVRQLTDGAELIIVNDGSSKNSPERLARLANDGIKLISYNNNQGKGHALREGVKAAAGELIIYTDIDFPYTHGSFLKIYNALKQGDADVVIGVRGDEYYTHLPKTRVRISKMLRLFIRKFLRIPTDDTQCGLKGFNQKGKEVFLQTTIDRYLFDLEFIFLAARKKLNMQQVVVELRPEIHLSKMNWQILMQESGNFLKIFAQSVF